MTLYVLKIIKNERFNIKLLRSRSESTTPWNYILFQLVRPLARGRGRGTGLAKDKIIVRLREADLSLK